MYILYIYICMCVYVCTHTHTYIKLCKKMFLHSLKCVWGGGGENNTTLTCQKRENKRKYASGYLNFLPTPNNIWKPTLLRILHYFVRQVLSNFIAWEQFQRAHSINTKIYKEDSMAAIEQIKGRTEKKVWQRSNEGKTTWKGLKMCHWTRFSEEEWWIWY